MPRVIDELVTILGFRSNTQGLDRAKRKVKDLDSQVQTFARGAQFALGAAFGVGTAAFFTGSQTERELAKLQTQLGDTSEQVEAIRPQLRDLAQDTTQPLNEIVAAFFNLKSSVQGITDAQALEVITAAAKGATIELGKVDDLALVAGVAIRQFGEDTISGQEALDILHSTIKSGTIPDAGALASGFGRLLGPGREAGLTFNELAAAVAGYSQTGQPVPGVIDAIRQAITQLNAPSAEAQKILDGVFPGATNSARALREMLGRDGLFDTLQFLRREIGDDSQALRRLVGDVNALGFIQDATGDKADLYTDALEANRNALGSVNAGLEIYKTTGAYEAQKATSNLRLALESLYNSAVIPLLKAFGQLPSIIQTVVVGMTTLSAASMLMGGPSVLGGLRLAVNLLSVAWWRQTLPIMVLRAQLKLLTLQTWLARAGQIALRVVTLAGAVATGIATAATWAWSAAMHANPIGIVILGLVALGAAIYATVRWWDDIRAAAVSAWDWMVAKVQWAWPVLKWVLTALGGPIAALIIWWDELRAAVMWVWDQIVDKVMWAWDKIKVPIEKVGGFFGGAAKKVGGFFGFGGGDEQPAGQQFAGLAAGGGVGGQAALAMFNGLAAGPGVLPVAPAGASTSTTMNSNRQVSLSIGDITINAQGADSQEIADNVDAILRDRMAALVIDLDGAVAR